MLSIIVPAFNEGSRIYDNLKVIGASVSGFTDEYEIIAVNDGSSDNTGDEIRRAASEDSHIIAAGYDKNRGKGGAIIEGVSLSPTSTSLLIRSQIM